MNEQVLSLSQSAGSRTHVGVNRSTLRVALVTGQFWPLVNEAQTNLANLADGMQACSARPTIVTAGYDARWPRRIVFREVPVVRIARPRRLGRFRFTLGLSRWLRRHAQDFDLVCACGLRHEAAATVQALKRTRLPIVLRAEQAGMQGDCQWQQRASFGRRIRQRCVESDAVIATSAAVESELRAAGYPTPRLHRIPNGVPWRPLCTPKAKLRARAALAQVNGDLTAKKTTPVVIHVGALHKSSNLDQLLRAWPAVLLRRADARLWLIGDGPARDSLYRQISDLELRGSVLMPGQFDDLRDVYDAADVFITTSADELSLPTLDAMQAALPVVGFESADNRKQIGGITAGLVVPGGDIKELATALAYLIDSRQTAVEMGQRGRDWVQQRYPLEQTVDAHLRLFEQLVLFHAER